MAKMVSITDTFTQGGQTQLHKLHMIKQVVGTTLWVSVGLGLAVMLILVFWELTFNDLLMVVAYRWSKLVVAYGEGASLFQNVTFPLPTGKKVVSCAWVAQDPHIDKFMVLAEGVISNAFMGGFWTGVLSFLGISCGWVWYGNKQKQPKLLNGISITPLKVLKKKLKKIGKSEIVLGKLPFPKELETEHILMVGTTGSGKTNTINQILTQTRRLHEKTIIVDTTGGYVARFYDGEVDKILNPFDVRSETWNLWQECLEDYHYMEFAETLVPPDQYDKFWIRASQQLLATAAETLKKEGDMTIKSLLDLLLTKPLDEAVESFKGTSVATYVDPESGKMAHGIRATLIAALWSLRYLEEANTYFSIKDWIQNPHEKGWLFITCQPDQRNVLRPLMTGWLSIAIKGLLAMPQDLNRRVWFILDELASLNYVPCLVPALEEIRKYGGCMVLGIQNYGQLNKIYGQNDANSLFDLTGTKIGMRSNGKAAEHLSQSFGQQEVEEPVQSISFGAHQMRDGVSISRQRVMRPVVSPTDLSLLDKIEAYVKFPRNLPMTKMKFPLYKKPDCALPFVKKISKVIPEKELRNFINLSQELYGNSRNDGDAKENLEEVA